jgi:hypothetical protein
MHLGLPTGIELYISPPGKLEFGAVELEVLCRVHKLPETWDGKRVLVKETDFKLPEARSDDPMNKSFQISANASKPEPVKVRERDGCRDWRMREFYITVGNRE